MTRAFAGILKARFPAVRVIQGDAFDLARTLNAREIPPFAAILSGLPLLNFPLAARKKLVEGALARLAPGAPFVQFSYGLHSPAVPPPAIRCCGPPLCCAMCRRRGVGCIAGSELLLRFMLQHGGAA